MSKSEFWSISKIEVSPMVDVAMSRVVVVEDDVVVTSTFFDVDICSLASFLIASQTSPSSSSSSELKFSWTGSVAFSLTSLPVWISVLLVSDKIELELYEGVSTSRKEPLVT